MSGAWLARSARCRNHWLAAKQRLYLRLAGCQWYYAAISSNRFLDYESNV
jgi:uncharacterized CHY-type Zn-finger protein